MGSTDVCTCMCVLRFTVAWMIEWTQIHQTHHFICYFCCCCCCRVFRGTFFFLSHSKCHWANPYAKSESKCWCFFFPSPSLASTKLCSGCKLSSPWVNPLSGIRSLRSKCNSLRLPSSPPLTAFAASLDSSKFHQIHYYDTFTWPLSLSVERVGSWEKNAPAQGKCVCVCVCARFPRLLVKLGCLKHRHW